MFQILNKNGTFIAIPRGFGPDNLNLQLEMRFFQKAMDWNNENKDSERNSIGSFPLKCSKYATRNPPVTTQMMSPISGLETMTSTRNRSDI